MIFFVFQEMEILFLCINARDIYLQFLRCVRADIVKIMPSWKIAVESISSEGDPFFLQTILNDVEYDKIVLFIDSLATDVIHLAQSYIDAIREFYGESKLPVYVAESIHLERADKNGFTIVNKFKRNRDWQDQYSYAYIPLNVSEMTYHVEPKNSSGEMYAKYFQKDYRVYLPAINLIFYLGHG